MKMLYIKKYMYPFIFILSLLALSNAPSAFAQETAQAAKNKTEDKAENKTKDNSASENKTEDKAENKTEDNSASENTTEDKAENKTEDNSVSENNSPVQKEQKELNTTAAVPSEGVKIDTAQADAETDENKNKPTRHMFIIAYNMAIPVGNTRDFTSSFSPRGMGFEYRFHITPKIAVGALFNWQAFETKETGTTVRDNLTVNGTRIKVMESMPISASFVYNFLPVNSTLVPFAGVDLGAYRLWKSINFGWTSFVDDEWHFGIAPKIGILFSLGKIPFFIGSKFNLLVRTKDNPANYYVGLEIGIALKR
jgi:hypothetical protein